MLWGSSVLHCAQKSQTRGFLSTRCRGFVCMSQHPVAVRSSASFSEALAVLCMQRLQMITIDFRAPGLDHEHFLSALQAQAAMTSRRIEPGDVILVQKVCNGAKTRETRDFKPQIRSFAAVIIVKVDQASEEDSAADFLELVHAAAVVNLSRGA
eukprot:6183556-Amphidinium_carterae.3